MGKTYKKNYDCYFRGGYRKIKGYKQRIINRAYDLGKQRGKKKPLDIWEDEETCDDSINKIIKIIFKMMGDLKSDKSIVKKCIRNTELTSLKSVSL